MRILRDVFVLMRKEWRVLLGEPVMIGILVFAFIFNVMLAGSQDRAHVNNASVGIVDLDGGDMAERFSAVLRPPYFKAPQTIAADDVDEAMNKGLITFALQIPPGFTADLLAGRETKLELLVDATDILAASAGTGYIQAFVRDDLADFLGGRPVASVAAPDVVFRLRFNPNFEEWRYSAVMELVSMITLVGIILTGSAVLREKERGTLEHLLVMPIPASAIIVSKILANVIVLFVCTTASLLLVIERYLGMGLAGSVWLYLSGAALHMFSVTAIGVFIALAVRSTQEFGLVCLILVMAMMMLSGTMTPVENMPGWLQAVMSLTPSLHFVQFATDVVFRGADLGLVWPGLLKMAAIGLIFTVGAVAVFRVAVMRSIT